MSTIDLKQLDTCVAEAVTTSKKELKNLANWGTTAEGKSYADFTSEGQLAEVLGRFDITDTKSAFSGLKIESNPLSNQKKILGSDVSGTFENCTEMKDAKNFNAPYAKNASKFFAGASKIEAVEGIVFPKNTDGESMFDGCVKLAAITDCKLGGNFVRTKRMYAGTLITAIDEIDTSNVVDMSEMFDGCEKLATVPTLNTKKANELSNLFRGCKALPEVFPYTIDLSSITDKTHIVDMFLNSGVKKIKAMIPASNTTLRGEISAEAFSSNKQISALIIYDEKGNAVNVMVLGDMSLANWFANGAKIGEISYANATLSTEFGSLENYNITDMNSAFKGGSAIVSLPGLLTDKVTNMTSAFEGCKNLIAIPQMNTARVVLFDKAFANCEKVADLSGINMQKATSIAQAFDGCKALTTLPQIPTYAFKDYRRLFYNCAMLPSVLPYVLDMTAISNAMMIQEVFGGDCSIREATVKLNVTTAEQIPTYIAPLMFGKNVETIHVVDKLGNVIADRTKDNTANITLKYTTPGTFDFVVPAGVTSVKVAAVSGAHIEFDAFVKDEIKNGANNTVMNVSSFGDKLVSLNSGIEGRGSYELSSSTDPTYADITHGYQPVFDAVYNEDKKNGYSGGLGSNYRFPNGGYAVHAFARPKESFVQNVVPVTPGETIKVTVGAGIFMTGTYGRNFNGTYAQGFVLVGIGPDLAK